MQRKLGSDSCEHFNHLDNNEFGQLRQRSLRSSLDIFDTLKQADPSIPAGMDNRIADNYRLQFAISDLAGGSWPERARSAAMKISGTVDVSSRNARLLAAIKAIYDARLEEEKKTPRLAIIDHDVRNIFIGTKRLIKALLQDPASEFREWHKGKPINQHQLWRVLDDFKISSTTDKAGKERGFYGWQFADAWDRYL
jgi:putative DNA primase/helicase